MANNYIELEAQEKLGSTHSIDWVERMGDKVDYHSGNIKHTITYADAAAAQAAVDAWLAEANSPAFDPLDLVDGELVEVDRASDDNSPKVPVFFKRAPTEEKPYWVFELLNPAGVLTYIHEPITIIKRP